MEPTGEGTPTGMTGEAAEPGIAAGIRIDHSADDVSEGAAALDRLRDEILLATLPNVMFDGWSMTSLRDGARMAGHSADDALRAFPGGIPDLVEHFSTWADRRMLEILEEQDLDSLKVRQRIALCVRTRLEVLAPNREAVSRLVAYLALPQNTALGLRLLYRTVDTMWYAAGDTATDFNHYTKRALLSGVYTTTTLYWLNDRSDGFQDSWEFLDRRINDVMRFGRATSPVGSVGNLLRLLPSPFRFARQVRRRARDI